MAMHPLVVIDASVWASRLMPQDINHVASAAWVERYRESGGLLTAPDFILVEIAAGLTRRTGQASLAKQSIRYLTYHGPVRIVPIERSLITRGSKTCYGFALESRRRHLCCPGLADQESVGKLGERAVAKGREPDRNVYTSNLPLLVCSTKGIQAYLRVERLVRLGR